MDERLIEIAFPIKQTSLDSVHEKMCHAGHIKAVHSWPARRPLAACRAALIATLLPDPGNAEERKKVLERLGGRLVKRYRKKKLPEGHTEEQTIEETEAGGGAIPLEAMRLGCEVTAIDINPVAWFILKCTLEYPQRFANQLSPFPTFTYESLEFMKSYFKAKGFKDAALRVQLESLGLNSHGEKTSQPQLTGIKVDVASVEADLAWHVRAWSWWILQKAKADLESFYPIIDGKPSVAYLWARTITCKNCRATVPLLKTRWLRKKDNKRVVLTMTPNEDKTGVVFGVQNDVPRGKGSAAQRRDHDKQLGGGTMSRSGNTCPCCGTIMTMEDISLESQRGRIGTIMTAVVIDVQSGKEYRVPTENEISMVAEAEQVLPKFLAEIPFGLPEESVPQGASRSSGGSPFTVYLYGLTRWCDLFTSRQLLVLSVFVKHTREAFKALYNEGYSPEWAEAIIAYLACIINKIADYNSSLVAWQPSGAKGGHTFERWALPIKWDFVENNVLESDSGGWEGITDWITVPLTGSLINATRCAPTPVIRRESAINISGDIDVIITDPPYYDAIQYVVM